MIATTRDVQRRDRVRKVIADALRHEINRTPARNLTAEIDAVCVAARDWAIDHGGYAPTLDEVRRIDRTAMGHIDWFSKLTLRVADLVVWGDPTGSYPQGIATEVAS